MARVVLRNRWIDEDKVRVTSNDDLEFVKPFTDKLMI